MKTYISQHEDKDLADMKDAVSFIKDEELLKTNRTMKHIAFYYMIMFMFMKGYLNNLYTHQLELFLEGAKSLLSGSTRDQIPKAISKLRRYQMTTRPPGVCIIFAVDEEREGCKSDVAAVQKVFKTDFNYDVFVKLNPKKKDVKQLITKLGESRNMFYDR